MDAMKAREKEKLEALRGIKKVMIEAKSAAGSTGELTDQECLKIIQKLAKQGTDSATIYKEQNRLDLYDQEMFQVKVFESYLPAKMSDSELAESIKAIIAEVGASGMKDMGKVIAVLKAKYAGQMDFGKASGLVKAALTG